MFIRSASICKLLRPFTGRLSKGYCDNDDTINYGVRFRISSSLQLQGYYDADWANDPNDRRSISGFYWFLGCSPISWYSKKQQVVSRSSTEEEYTSLANATTELLRNILFYPSYMFLISVFQHYGVITSTILL